jgi:hypothetical protein
MLWVARDENGFLGVFSGNPNLRGGIWLGPSGDQTDYLEIEKGEHPDLAPGECRELRMVEPFDEAKERQRFERHFVGKLRLMRDDHGEYCDGPPFHSWRGWLAAKRDERGG